MIESCWVDYSTDKTRTGTSGNGQTSFRVVSEEDLAGAMRFIRGNLEYSGTDEEVETYLQFDKFKEPLSVITITNHQQRLLRIRIGGSSKERLERAVKDIGLV